MQIKPVKLITAIKTFDDVRRSLQEVERVLNELKSSVNSEPEIEMKDEQGKPGDLRTNKNADNSYSLQLKTKEGWKVAKSQTQNITFVDKDSSAEKKISKSIDQLVSEDGDTGGNVANRSIYDETSDKFVLPRPDYDSGWITTASVVSHNLGTLELSLIRIIANTQPTNVNSYQAGFPTVITVTDENKLSLSNAPGNYMRVTIWK